MNKLELVLDGERQMYKLMCDSASNTYYFNVLVGGIGLYTVEFPLDADELDAYQKEGRSYLDDLASAVRARPEDYTARGKPGSA
jgi:hypothetical protein